MKLSRASWIDNAKSRTKKFELCVLHVYQDQKGLDTFGWGTNIERGVFEPDNASDLVRYMLEHIDDPQAVADYLFDMHYENCLSQIDILCDNRGIDFYELPLNAKFVLVDMLYNMGHNSLLGFKKMFKGIKSEDWQKAHDECLDSIYGRDKDTKYRARENAELLLSIMEV